MSYNLRTAVWEITMGCNMRCKHCGSKCEEKLQDELTTDEALQLCDQLADMGMEFITLSGGEPTTRKDWYLIAKKLVDRGIKTSLITNGWLCDDDLILKAKEVGIHSVAISIDGLKDTHDYIRRIGSFERDIDCIHKLNEIGIHAAVITTVNKKNIIELQEMFELFSDLKVSVWQLQIAMPMGNFKEHKDLYLMPEDIDRIIDFAYDRLGKGVTIALADCIGYYNQKSMAITRNHIDEDWCWQGCGAGKQSIGILYNGNITACTSLRSPEFIVDNIRNNRLTDIWNNSSNFAWNRNMKKELLKGLCKKCQYGEICLGGCSNSRLCTNGDVFSDNQFYSYHVAVSKFEESLYGLHDEKKLDELIRESVEQGEYQLAELLIAHKLNQKEDVATLELYAYVNYQLHNFIECQKINEKIISMDGNNGYAWKGLGLAKIEQKEVLYGVQCLFHALEINQNKSADLYYDICIVLQQLDLQLLLGELHNEAKKCPDYEVERFRAVL